MKIYLVGLVAFMLVSKALILSASESENRYYIIYDTGPQYEKAIHCEKYIKTHASWFGSEIKDIIKKYKQKDLLNVISALEQNEFVNFKKSIWDCSLYMKYAGKINYFREANTNLFEFITNIELAEETGIYINNDMDVIQSNLSNNISIILNSTKERRADDKYYRR